MNFPTKDFLSVVRDNWSLTAEGLTKDDIVFSQADFRTDEALKEQLNISFAGFPMERQDAKEEFFFFTCTAKVVYWSKAKTKEDLATDLDKVWVIVEEIKKRTDDESHWNDDWKHIQVMNVFNRTMVPPLPELIEVEVVVRIRLFWSVT